MSSVAHLVSTLTGPLAYALVGFLAFGESAAFLGVFLPGETALLVGGLLASQQRVSLALMMAVGVVAAIAGDSVGYEVGRRFGPRLRASRAGARVGAQRWERGQELLRQAGGRAVFVARFVAVLRALMPTMAGMARLPYRSFVVWNAAGGLLWGAGFVLVGYLAGGYLQLLHGYLRLGWIGLGAALGLVLAVRRIRRRRGQRGGRRTTVPPAEPPIQRADPVGGCAPGPSGGLTEPRWNEPVPYAPAGWIRWRSRVFVAVALGGAASVPAIVVVAESVDRQPSATVRIATLVVSVALALVAAAMPAPRWRARRQARRFGGSAS